MTSVQHDIRVPEALDREIAREARERGERDRSRTVVQLLDEAVRASRVPGIVFVQRPEGRRAAIAFSGLEVWEVVATWKEAGGAWETLVGAYPEVWEIQLRAALAYYRLHPEEIDERLEREARWTPERVYRELPYSRPRGP